MSDAARFDLCLTHARLATLAGDAGYGLVEDGAVACRGGRIVYAGPMRDLPAGAAEAAEAVDCRGALVTPALIDCHTHLVFVGDRAGEFEQRLEGASYEDIARAGGGIASTVRATRAASEDELVEIGLARARALVRDGVATIEIKSGYGLDVDSELRMLRAARRIGAALGIGVRTTFLGAHALPPEFAHRADDYIDFVCNTMLPAVAARCWARTLPGILLLAALIGGFCAWMGLSLSWAANLPAGPAIVLTASGIFFISVFFGTRSRLVVGWRKLMG